MADDLVFDTSFFGEISQNRFADQLTSVWDKIKASWHTPLPYGFVNTVQSSKLLDETSQALAQFSWCKQLLILGIGGSDLGGRAIQQAFGHQDQPFDVFFGADTPDPAQLRSLQSRLDLAKTAVVVISKSGSTVEVISQLIFWQQQYSQQNLDWAQHTIVVTDPDKGFLKDLSDRHSLPLLAIPPEVGGRFSVLTPVGWVVTQALGINSHRMLLGASQATQSDHINQMAQSLAVANFQMLQQGRSNLVIMPYSSRLELFGRWFRQLWAESLGKARTGVYPIASIGPADQHSQLQLYTQGPGSQWLVFIELLGHDDIAIPSNSYPEFRLLQNKSFGDLLRIELQATRQALSEAGTPSLTLQIPHLDEYYYGKLIMLFELAVVYLAELLELNPFDQPGVQRTKELIENLLNK